MNTIFAVICAKLEFNARNLCTIGFAPPCAAGPRHAGPADVLLLLEESAVKVGMGLRQGRAGAGADGAAGRRGGGGGGHLQVTHGELKMHDGGEG